MQDFVRLVQRYRGTYVTAIFVSVGWVLGQILGARPSDSSAGGAMLLPPETLEQLRQRPDVAAVLCAIPLVNVLFVTLMLEANAQIQSLARYRFLLGVELGEGEPVWRWEIWKTLPEGSIRAWTNPSNVFFTLVAIALTIASLWFSAPAAWNHRGLWWVWFVALLFPISLLVVVTFVGVRRIRVNEVADPPTTTWSMLQMSPRKSGRLHRLLGLFRRGGERRDTSIVSAPAGEPSRAQPDSTQHTTSDGSVGDDSSMRG
jgi:hypothetical protein